MAKINQGEYELLKDLDDKWKWIARDRDTGKLPYSDMVHVYEEKPFKTDNVWTVGYGAGKLEKNLFQFIQWEDENPYNIADLIEEYESEEAEVKKDIEWLKEEMSEILLTSKKDGTNYFYYRDLKEKIYNAIDQLDKPEVLSQEWIDENKTSIDRKLDGTPIYKVREELLQNLLVPKQELEEENKRLNGLLITMQEEVDQAYKDGYEKGKQHSFYKGYLEGLADKESEPETVASVLDDFYKSLERMKEVLNMEVEELEE